MDYEKIDRIKDNLKNRIRTIKQEYEQLGTSINHIKANRYSIKFADSKQKKLEKRRKELESKLIEVQKYYDELWDVQKSYILDKEAYDKAEEPMKDIIRSSMERNEEELNNTIRKVEKIMEENNDSLLDRIKTGAKNHKKGIAITLAGLVGVGTISYAAGRIIPDMLNNNEDPDATNSLDSSAHETLSPSEIPTVDPSMGIDPSENPTVTPSSEVTPGNGSQTGSGSQIENDPQASAELTASYTTAKTAFYDILDEEERSARAYEAIEALNTNAKGHDYTIEEMENIMNWVNNGVVEDPSQAAALYTELRVENIWNKENGKEVEKPFDTSILFKDGTQGQKLAKKIFDIRVGLMNAKTDEEYKKYAQDFTVLLVNSWVLNGANNEISVYVLETSFSKALLDSYFLNTYAMIHEANLVVTVNGEEFNLDEVAKKVDEANCPATMLTPDGKEVATIVNKFTSDMIGAEAEATRTKEASYTLSK